jgi:acetyl esterase/lipase
MVELICSERQDEKLTNMRNLLLFMIGIGCLTRAVTAVLGGPYLSPSEINRLPSAPADARIPYGTDPNQFADLRLPAGDGPHPVVIVIHGGCWIERYADLQNTAALADALRKEGVATYNVEYRRADQSGGGWPGTFLDVAAAADVLRELAPKYRLDLRRVLTLGHSAGGHLALWLAARPRLPLASPLHPPDPLPVQGVIAMGALGDLKRFQPIESEVCGDNVVTQLMGGSPEQWPERYADGSPRELLPLGVPQIFINGEDETVSPPEQVSQFVDAAMLAGDRAVLRVVPGAGHHECNSPDSVAWPYVRDAVRELLP